MSRVLFFALPEGENYGWGLCGKNLGAELSKKLELVKVKLEENHEIDLSVPGKLFIALDNRKFLPTMKMSGSENYGYTFFENNLLAESEKNAKKYSFIFCGSTWCQEQCYEKNIKNTKILIQGIDPKNFFYQKCYEKREKFVIFSGGKFEFRKAQDLVLKAFKILQDKYDDIFLVTSWYNHWPETMKTMYFSENFNLNLNGNTWQKMMFNLYQSNGINPERVKTYGIIPNQKMKTVFDKTDIGIFPNRCEGGTNLVLMEYMACGKPAVVSYYSGHKDIVNNENALLLENFKKCEDKRLELRWEEVSVEEIVHKIEYAYHHREEIKIIGEKAGEFLKKFTWENMAKKLIKEIFS